MKDVNVVLTDNGTFILPESVYIVTSKYKEEL